ncbi:MAG TPA: hypothetical protein VIG25_23290 [Pyrinomonadaceae bacterium]
MARTKTAREIKTRTLRQGAVVEVRFDVTVDPTPYEKRESQLGRFWVLSRMAK